MIAEIIAVGNELLIEESLNQDYKVLVRQLAPLGIAIKASTMAGDSATSLRRALATAVSRSDVIFVIGGMDPKTKTVAIPAVSEAVGIPLTLHQESLEHIRLKAQLKEEDGRENETYAYLPQDAVVFKNDLGVAPGCAIEKDKQTILMLPDDPKQFNDMFATYVFPYLLTLAGNNVVSRIMRAFGMNRQEAEKRLGELLNNKNPSLWVSEKNGELFIRVTAGMATEQESLNACNAMIKQAMSQLDHTVYGVDIEGMQNAVIGLLLKKNVTLAAAESSIGGLMTQKLKDVKGSENAFVYAISASANRTKSQTLKVPERIIKKYGVVSGEVAAAMAIGVRHEGGSQLGVAVTGASNSSGSTVFIALSDPQEVWVKKLTLSKQIKDREQMKQLISLHSLNMVREYLVKFPNTPEGGIPVAKAMQGAVKLSGTMSEGGSQSTKRVIEGPWYKKAAAAVLPWKGDDAKEVIRKSILLVAVVVMVWSLTYIGSYFMQSNIQQGKAENWQDMYHNSGANVEIPAGYPSDYQESFAALYAENPDVVGYIDIEGTRVDYPVVQCGNNEYYLKHGFDHAETKYGTPFVDYRNVLKGDNRSDNILVYGHNMDDGQIFNDLLQYRYINFYKEHPVIDFNTVYEDAKWKVVGAFITHTLEKHGPIFDYHNFHDAANDQEFLNFVEEVRKRSFVLTGVDVQPGDQLLTLSTCSYAFEEARMVVVARKVRDGEDPTVDVSKAKVNPNPVQSKPWYDQYTSKPPASTTASSNGNESSSSDSSSMMSSSGSSSQLSSSMSSQVSSGISSLSSSQSSSQSSSSLSSSQSSSSLPSSQSSSQSSSSQSSSHSSSSQSSSQSSAGQPSSESETQPPSNSTAPPPANEPSSSPPVVEDPGTADGMNGLVEEQLSITANGQVITGNASYILEHVVANEMNSSMDTQAIKAQAVAAHTYILYYNQLGQSPSVGFKESVPQKIKEAVASVKNQVITKNGSVIYSPYFSCSAGYTNNSSDVWGGSYSYLTSVESKYDYLSSYYDGTYTLSKSAFATALQKVGISVDPSSLESAITDIQMMDNGAYVDTITIAGKTITGRQMRETVLGFKIKSAAFDISFSGDNVVFTTHGYGHGAGMSQWGAHYYAVKEGWSYSQILSHYYQGTTLSTR